MLILLVGAIVKVDHCKIEVKGVVNLVIKLQSVQRNQRKVVKRREFVNRCSCRKRRRHVVDQPAGHVPVEVVRDAVKEVLQK